MNNLSGHIIKGYELQERIGIGGFGVVYKALQSTVGRKVVLKIILSHFANPPDFDDFSNWSPDGTKILFNLDRDGNLEIYVMNADGSDPVNLTHNIRRNFTQYGLVPVSDPYNVPKFRTHRSQSTYLSRMTFKPVLYKVKTLF